jgi:hypothetical protein
MNSADRKKQIPQIELFLSVGFVIISVDFLKDMSLLCFKFRLSAHNKIMFCFNLQIEN